MGMAPESQRYETRSASSFQQRTCQMFNPAADQLAMVITKPTHDNDMTRAEHMASLQRIVAGGINSLTSVTPLSAFGGASAIFVVAAYESTFWFHTIDGKPSNQVLSNWTKCKYMARYGMHNIIPSFIWETQPATIIAESVDASLTKHIHVDAKALRKHSPENYMRYIRSLSVRGAIAGSVLLGQVVAVVQLGKSAQESYYQRVFDGREPPLDTGSLDADPKNIDSGVVIRLAGEASDVTLLSMAQEGRRRYFPIYESSECLDVKSLIQNYGACSSSASDKPRVPVYWQVSNGRYGYNDSWRGLVLPDHWLFNVNLTARGVREGRPSKLLILEADATSGEMDSLSLKRTTSTDLDLDLYEVSEGFNQIQNCVNADRAALILCE